METAPNTPEPTVTITINNQKYTVSAGISVAAAILMSTDNFCFCKSRPQDGIEQQSRGPHCLMGVCFDCLAQINGVPDRQTCLVTVENGMEVSLNNNFSVKG